MDRLVTLAPRIPAPGEEFERRLAGDVAGALLDDVIAP
jgi:hypothetical protein